MVIAVNTRFLIKDYLEGYGNFIRECLARLTKQFPKDTFIFIFDRPYDPSFIFSDNIIPVILPPRARHPLLWWIWYNIQIPGILRRYKASVFVSMDGFCSLFTKVPQVLVVHDLAFIHYPGFVKISHLLFYKRFTPLFLRRAKVIATVSEFSKNDIMETYKVEEKKISVVYNGVNELFKPLQFEERENSKIKYSGGNEYFLCTSAIHPRKNLVHLLKAFSVFKKKSKSGMKLVIAGRFAWHNEDFSRLLKTYKYREEINVLGYVNQEELVKLTAGAYAIVYPSLFEGFGVPVIEGMKCGVPVLTGNVSAMPEIAGDAALYFDPQNFQDIADKLMLIFKDEKLRQQYVQKGTTRASVYSWERTSALLGRCIERAVTS